MASLAERQGKPGDGLAVLDEAERRLGDHVELRLARTGSWAAAAATKWSRSWRSSAAETPSSPETSGASCSPGWRMRMSAPANPRRRSICGAAWSPISRTT